MTLIRAQFVETPRLHRFTREEYYQMADAGVFQDQRVELIEGEIVDMAPQKNAHVLGVSLVASALTRVFGEEYWVRTQAPLHMVDDSEPEPDVAVVAGPMKAYKDHPTTALLVVEVADTTLRFDRGRKAGLYARAGIKDYWVVNIPGKCLEVMREPVEDAGEAVGWRYGSVATLRVGERVEPLAKAGAAIGVAELLP